MNPYEYYQGYIPQQSGHFIGYGLDPYQAHQVDSMQNQQLHFNPNFPTQNQFEPDRQPPQFQGLERRLNALERQNERQTRELTRLNNEVEQQAQQIERMNRRLNRVNQRLRVVENRLHITFTPFDGEF
ncbi:hypothetical protein RCG23_09615 [Neobacillus sp. PS3-34]|uniref:hypothetical protein n=1 Tax=Neobacillus sp. PS3-34 TaxID=3070678 RepID=UPI0027E19CD1|nr:hypothetical protein [Neobacillus sp. PS3-34]WML50073.1 hypothetical protein RCG23_09615 [Neobacillus sp. PS3-34]